MEYSEAVEIIKSLQQEAPVKLAPVTNVLGASVEYTDDCTDDVCGAIRRNPEYDGSWGQTIFVNQKHLEVRQRFTIVHEIAHLVLLEELIGDGVVDGKLYRTCLGDRKDLDANRFAAWILIPEKLVNQALEEGRTSVQVLARDFNVSREAMSICRFPAV